VHRSVRVALDVLQGIVPLVIWNDDVALNTGAPQRGNNIRRNQPPILVEQLVAPWGRML
jgi:hypothetical protein